MALEAILDRLSPSFVIAWFRTSRGPESNVHASPMLEASNQEMSKRILSPCNYCISLWDSSFQNTRIRHPIPHSGSETKQNIVSDIKIIQGLYIVPFPTIFWKMLTKILLYDLALKRSFCGGGGGGGGGGGAPIYFCVGTFRLTRYYF